MKRGISITENGDKRANIDIPLTANGIKVTMGLGTLITVILFITTFLFGAGKLPFGKDAASGETDQGMLSFVNARKIAEHILVDTEHGESIAKSLDEINQCQRENRRFMVALFKQIKLLCEAQGVPILYEPEDFFNGTG